MPDSATDDPLVTIATFPEPMEANMARTVLEGAGIAVWMNGENANNMVPVAFTAQLQVSLSDETEARRLLQQMEDSPESIESVTAAEIAAQNRLPTDPQ